MGYGGGINLYGYCGNGPVEGSDPLGLADGDDDSAGSFYANALNQGWNGPGGVGEGFADGSQERGKFSQFLHQIPGVGTVLGGAEAAIGCDYVAGKQVSTFQRVMGGVGVILAGAGFIARGLGAGEEAISGGNTNRIALGLGEDLENFRKSMDAVSYERGGVWGTGFGGSVNDFYTAIREADEVRINLTAPNDSWIYPAGAAKLGGDLGCSVGNNVTNWEMFVLSRSSDYWDKMYFWVKQDGEYIRLPNPFK